MIQLVSQYSDYLKQIPELLKQSPYKTAFIIEKLEMPKPTFYRKLKDNNFSVGEVQIITKLLFPKETILKEIKENILQSRSEIEIGNYKMHETFMDEIKNEFL